MNLAAFYWVVQSKTIISANSTKVVMAVLRRGDFTLFSISFKKLLQIAGLRAWKQYLAKLVSLFGSLKLFWSTQLHIYDLLFQTDVGRFEGKSLFLSCAWTEVLAAKLFDKHLVHLES